MKTHTHRGKFHCYAFWFDYNDCHLHKTHIAFTTQKSIQQFKLLHVDFLHELEHTFTNKRTNALNALVIAFYVMNCWDGVEFVNWQQNPNHPHNKHSKCLNSLFFLLQRIFCVWVCMCRIVHNGRISIEMWTTTKFAQKICIFFWKGVIYEFDEISFIYTLQPRIHLFFTIIEFTCDKSYLKLYFISFSLYFVYYFRSLDY